MSCNELIDSNHALHVGEIEYFLAYFSLHIKFSHAYISTISYLLWWSKYCDWGSYSFLFRKCRYWSRWWIFPISLRLIFIVSFVVVDLWGSRSISKSPFKVEVILSNMLAICRLKLIVPWIPPSARLTRSIRRNCRFDFWCSSPLLLIAWNYRKRWYFPRGKVVFLCGCIWFVSKLLRRMMRAPWKGS